MSSPCVSYLLHLWVFHLPSIDTGTNLYPIWITPIWDFANEGVWKIILSSSSKIESGTLRSVGKHLNHWTTLPTILKLLYRLCTKCLQYNMCVNIFEHQIYIMHRIQADYTVTRISTLITDMICQINTMLQYICNTPYVKSFNQ